MYSGYGIAFDQKGTWNFGNDRTRNVIIFGNNNSSSSHTDNCKNDLLVLREGYSFVTNRSFCAQKKKFSIKIQNFVWVYITTVTIFLFVHWKEVFKFKASNGTVNFPTQLFLGIISIKFGAREVYLGGNVCYFLVD